MPEPLKDADTIRFASRPISGWAAKTSRTSSCFSGVSGTIVCRDRSMTGWLMGSLKHDDPERKRGLRSAARCVDGSEAESAGQLGAGCRVPPAGGGDRLFGGLEEPLPARGIGGSGGPELQLPLAPLAAGPRAHVGRLHPVVDELGD